MGHGRASGKDGQCRAQCVRGGHARPFLHGNPRPRQDHRPLRPQQVSQDQTTQAAIAGEHGPGQARPCGGPAWPSSSGRRGCTPGRTRPHDTEARPGGQSTAVPGPCLRDARLLRKTVGDQAPCLRSSWKQWGRSGVTLPAPRPREQFPGPAPTPTQTLAGTAKGLGLTRRGVLGSPGLCCPWGRGVCPRQAPGPRLCQAAGRWERTVLTASPLACVGDTWSWSAMPSSGGRAGPHWASVARRWEVEPGTSPGTSRGLVGSACPCASLHGAVRSCQTLLTRASTEGTAMGPVSLSEGLSRLT